MLSLQEMQSAIEEANPLFLPFERKVMPMTRLRRTLTTLKRVQSLVEVNKRRVCPRESHRTASPQHMEDGQRREKSEESGSEHSTTSKGEDVLMWGDCVLTADEEPPDTPGAMWEQAIEYGDFKFSPRAEQWQHSAPVISANFNYEESEVLSEEKPGTFAFSDFTVSTSQGSENEPMHSRGGRVKSLYDSGEVFTFGDFVVPAGTSAASNKTQVEAPTISETEEPRMKQITAYTEGTFLGHSSTVKCLAIHTNEKYYVSCSNADIEMHRFASGECVQLFNGHHDLVTSLAVSTDSKYMASTSRDCTLCIWDTTTACQLSCFRHPKNVTCCSFSQNGQYIVTGCHDWLCRLFPTHGKRSTEPIQVFKEHTAIVYCVDFEPNGEFVVSGSADASVRVWSAVTGYQRHLLGGHTGPVHSAKFSPDASMILSNDRLELRCWNADTGECLMRFAPSDIVQVPGCDDKKLCWGLSCFAPGMYFKNYIVATTTHNTLHIINTSETSQEESSLTLYAKKSIMSLHRGCLSSIIYGDVEGNVYYVRLQ